MAALQGKRIIVIGGSSGIGYSVAKASLLSLAEHVTIASSSQAKVAAAVERLLADPDLLESEGLYLILGAPLDAVISSVCLRKRMDIVRTEGSKDHVRASDYRMSIVPCPRMRSCNSKKLL